MKEFWMLGHLHGQVLFMKKNKYTSMKNNTIFSVIAFYLITSIPSSCNAQDCQQLPTKFTSYDQAIKKVQASNFEKIESVNTSKSSWIRGATYYSCDLKKGFLIIKSDVKDYIHQNVPIETWNSFKVAASFGSYYSKNIKGRYQLELVIQ